MIEQTFNYLMINSSLVLVNRPTFSGHRKMKAKRIIRDGGHCSVSSCKVILYGGKEWNELNAHFISENDRRSGVKAVWC
jgi:hypothetical protein